MGNVVALIVFLSVPAVDMAPVLHFECLRATEAVVVDGKAEEAAWKDAKPITEFRLWTTLGEPTERTTVRFCYDDVFLYAFYECDDKDLYTLYQARDARIWESDCIELFLWPDEGNAIYYEFEVAPNNAVFDARMVNTGSGGYQRWAQWNCEVRTATQLEGTLNQWRDRDEGYTVEVAIPLGALCETIGEGGLEGQTWRFAAVRADLSVTLRAAERSSTANVPEGDVHRKDGYFTLTFK